jgi:membrane protease YdiL (CAAX protease family)
MVLLVYPVLSAYSQELMFRTLFYHRYAALFRHPLARALASGLAFGWAHIVVHDATAMVLATLGGILFASTYERHRSTLLVALEHALYGDFVFTIGLGGLFYTPRHGISPWVR